MRNSWMLLLGLTVVVAIGGAVYYFFPKQLANTAMANATASKLPSADDRPLAVPAGNPLLTANSSEFDRWVPSYPIRCGEIVFETTDPKSPNFSFCIGEIEKRVAASTSYQPSRGDVLDQRVKAHWRDVMREK